MSSQKQLLERPGKYVAVDIGLYGLFKFQAQALAQRANEHLPKSSKVTVTIPPEDIASLQQECAASWNKLKEVQAELVNLRKPAPVGEGDESIVKIQQAKEKLLLGTKLAYKDLEPSILPGSYVIRQQICLSELEQSLKEMYDELTYVRTRRQKVKEELERNTILLDQRKQIRDELQRKLQSLETENVEDRPDSSFVEEMKEKRELAEKYNKKLMKKLRRFIEEHFPRPTDKEVSEATRKRHKSNSSATDVLPLQTIIQELMNKCLDSDDPYIKVDDRYWPLYMQLLVRCGVAQRDPADDTRFRMTPFHL